jgi:hypothetical protein
MGFRPRVTTVSGEVAPERHSESARLLTPQASKLRRRLGMDSWSSTAAQAQLTCLRGFY